MLCYSANRICAAVPREVVYIPQTVIVWYHEMSVVCFHTNAHLKTDTARLTNTHRGMHFRLDRKFVGRGQAHTQKFWPYVPQLSLICLYQIHQSLEWKSWLISACRMNWLTKCRHVYNMTKISFLQSRTDYTNSVCMFMCVSVLVLHMMWQNKYIHMCHIVGSHPIFP